MAVFRPQLCHIHKCEPSTQKEKIGSDEKCQLSIKAYNVKSTGGMTRSEKVHESTLHGLRRDYETIGEETCVTMTYKEIIL